MNLPIRIYFKNQVVPEFIEYVEPRKFQNELIFCKLAVIVWKYKEQIFITGLLPTSGCVMKIDGVNGATITGAPTVYIPNWLIYLLSKL